MKAAMKSKLLIKYSVYMENNKHSFSMGLKICIDINQISTQCINTMIINWINKTLDSEKSQQLNISQ